MVMHMALVGVAPNEVLLPGDIVLTLEVCPVKVSSIRDWTVKDPILAGVK